MLGDLYISPCLYQSISSMFTWFSNVFWRRIVFVSSIFRLNVSDNDFPTDGFLNKLVHDNNDGDSFAPRAFRFHSRFPFHHSFPFISFHKHLSFISSLVHHFFTSNLFSFSAVFIFVLSLPSFVFLLFHSFVFFIVNPLYSLFACLSIAIFNRFSSSPTPRFPICFIFDYFFCSSSFQYTVGSCPPFLLSFEQQRFDFPFMIFTINIWGLHLSLSYNLFPCFRLWLT